jgi:hypothetical protein
MRKEATVSSEIVDAGKFLLARLDSFERDCEFNDETYREWGGHVIPALERFRLALEALPSRSRPMR